MSNDKNIDILNDVTAKLIDSCKGYEMCSEISDDNLILKNQFIKRQNDRQSLINAFQLNIKTKGGDVKENGSVTGSIHRGFTKFKSLFKDDFEAAAEALDSSEEHLANFISERLSVGGLSSDTSLLLRKAHASALEGERFADFIDN